MFYCPKNKDISHHGEKIQKGAQIQDGGRIFLCLLTKKLDLALKNSHTKPRACC